MTDFLLLCTSLATRLFIYPVVNSLCGIYFENPYRREHIWHGSPLKIEDDFLCGIKINNYIMVCGFCFKTAVCVFIRKLLGNAPVG